jgi:hypothetical protein
LFAVFGKNFLDDTVCKNIFRGIFIAKMDGKLKLLKDTKANEYTKKCRL